MSRGRYNTLMLDIQFIRENAELVQEKSKQKQIDADVDKLLQLDTERRNLLAKIEKLRAERNQIASALKSGEPSDEQIQKGRQVKEQIVQAEALLGPIQDTYEKLLNTVPNLHFDDVPVGGEEQNAEIKKVGDTNGEAQDHLEFALGKDWVDFERGAKVAGNKFYYLKGDLVLLENAVTQFALEIMNKKSFQLISVPNMVNSRIATGTGFAPRSSEQSDEYFIEGEDLALIATAEIPLTGLHADEIIEETALPLAYASLSPCYRKEAGAYGKHTRGLFRVHQFNKLEMYLLTTPETSQEMHEKLLEVEEEIWQALEIPYRVVNVASGELGAPAAKKYDIEYWSKTDKIYRELTSCSNCTDFQARNLNIKFKRKDGSIDYIHTLNGTAVSLARTLVAMIEHYQTKEGKLKIPETLQPYMNGREEI